MFYHRTTNNTVMSRRGCVEKIQILEDGTIPQVEMTSLGFEDALSPYETVKAEIACVLIGGCFISESSPFSRRIQNIKNDAVIGYKYFEFGEDYGSSTMLLSMHLISCGASGTIHVLLDDYKSGEEIGIIEFNGSDEIITARVKNVTGRHALYFLFQDKLATCLLCQAVERPLCQLEEFVFMK